MDKSDFFAFQKIRKKKKIGFFEFLSSQNFRLQR